MPYHCSDLPAKRQWHFNNTWLKASVIHNNKPSCTFSSTFNISNNNLHNLYRLRVRVLSDIHVLFLQELWLIDNHRYKLNDAFKNCNVFSVSGVHDVSNLHGRPYGGCAIIIKKTVRCKLTCVSTISKTNYMYIIDVWWYLYYVMFYIYAMWQLHIHWCWIWWGIMWTTCTSVET